MATHLSDGAAATVPDNPTSQQQPSTTSSDATTMITTPTRMSLSARLTPRANKLRKMIAPVLVAFLAFIFVVVHALARLGGQYAFLCHTSVILFFFPKGRVSEQIESNVINLLGAVCGLAWTQAVLAVAAWCGAHYQQDASQARAVLGIGLAILALTGGFLRSWAPRLNVACRAAMFYSIFILTSEQNITKYTAHLFTEQFFVALFAFIFSTVVGCALSEHSSSPHLGANLLQTLSTTCQLLPTSLRTVMETDDDDPSTSELEITLSIPVTPITPGLAEKATQPSPHGLLWMKQQKLAKQLRSQVAAMRASHASYMLDIVHARQHPGTLVPIIRALARLQRNPLLGPTGHVPGERIRTALERTLGTPEVSRSSSRQTSRSGTPARRHSRSVMSAIIGGTSGAGTPTLLGPASALRDRRSTLLPGVQTHLPALQLVQKLSKVATHQAQQQRIASGGSNAHRSPARSKLTLACATLSDAIVASLMTSARHISAACDWRTEHACAEACLADHGDASTKCKECDAADIEANLEVALRDLQKRLSGIIDTGDVVVRSDGVTISPLRGVTFEDETMSADWLDDEDRFRIAFYMIALLDLAKDTQRLFDMAIRLKNNAQPKRWIFPHIIWPWSKVTPETPIPTAAGEIPPEQQDPETDDHHQDLDFVHALLREDARPREFTKRSFGTRLLALWLSFWDKRGVVATRVLVSQTLHSLKHSRHVHFAIKNTIGISLLSLPAFLPLGTAGRSWYDGSHGAWMVISFMYVIEVTTGATMRLGFYRTLGTFIGAVVAYVCTVIAGVNPYGLVALATAASVPISYGILFTDVAPMAVVTGITLPPIMFIQYLGEAGGQSTFRIAWERFVDIEIGIAAAVLLGSWLWPIHARVQYFRNVSDTLDHITEYYLNMSRDLLRPSLVYQDNEKKYIPIEAAVRRSVAQSRTLASIQNQELSLLPRPFKLYSEVIDLTERLIETFAEIRVLRFSLPRKATVLDVLPIRRELVSSLLMNLWACGQAFRSRHPLPQLLPSPRVPLGEVMDATDEHARHVRTMRARENRRRHRATEADELDGGGGGFYYAGAGRRGSSHPSQPQTPNNDGTSNSGHHAELAVMYGMAENEALGEAINAIEELLAAARTLFGTQSFMDATAAGM